MTLRTGPRFLSEDFLRPDRGRALGPRREKARRTRGEAAQTSGCPGRLPRREKARPTQGERVQTSGCLAGTRWVLPIHSDICLQCPAFPQQDWTELANLNKRSPPPACVRAEIRHRRDGKQKPNKQRESLQKGPVQQIKIPEGNTDYTRRSL